MSLKRKINKNELTIGTWITINNPLIPDILSSAGFDWLCVDLEHSAIDLNDLMTLIISIENNNIYSLVRVGENNPGSDVDRAHNRRTSKQVKTDAVVKKHKDKLK